MPCLKYKRLKLKLRVFLAGHSVAMATYCDTKIIPTCSPVIGQFFGTMIVASIDKRVTIMTHQNLSHGMCWLTHRTLERDRKQAIHPILTLFGQWADIIISQPKAIFQLFL